MVCRLQGGSFASQVSPDRLGRPDHCSTHVTPRYSLLYSTVYGLYEHGSYTIVVVAAAGAGALGKPTEARTLAPYMTGLQLT